MSFSSLKLKNNLVIAKALISPSFDPSNILIAVPSNVAQ